MHKIAIVDDEPLMLEGFSKAMDWRANGYDLIGAFRSPAGITEFCERESPEILLLDITMPELDGISVLKAVKSHFPEIIVIMLTAHNEFSLVRESLRYHADEYLWKPEISFDDILECMNRLISQKEKNTKKEHFPEFTDVPSVSRQFPHNELKKLLDNVEYDLKMSDFQEAESAVRNIISLIVRYQPRKDEIIGSILRAGYLYQETVRSYYSDNDLKEIENQLLDLLGAHSTYQLFADELDVLFKKFSDMVSCTISADSHQLENRIKEYIEEHIADSNLSLLDVANAVGISYSYCSKLFKSISGKTFSKYIIEERMKQACEYLKDSTYKTDHILELVGYTDKSYFIKSFREYTSMTPAEYRKHYQAQSSENQHTRFQFRH